MVDTPEQRGVILERRDRSQEEKITITPEWLDKLTFCSMEKDGKNIKWN